MPPDPIGFLHTAQVHVATFDGLLAGRATAAHVVRPDLLDRARVTGVDDALRADIRAALVQVGTGAVVCTCSTIGGPAEDEGRALGVTVLRVDRPMAEWAVHVAAATPRHRLAVVAALDSTIGPTCDLVRSVAREQDATVELVTVTCPGAWDHFERGDTDAYVRSVATAIRSAHADDPVDVVVLAQASTAPAAALLADLGVPVLSSPAAAVAAALALVDPAG